MRCTSHGGPNPGLARGGHTSPAHEAIWNPFPRVSRAVQGQRGMGAPLHDGIPRQGYKVRGLWHGVCVHSRGTIVFPRQAVQERTETLQELQSQAGCRGRGRFSRALADENRDADELLAVRQGDDGAVSSYARTAGAVPGVFSARAARRECLTNIPGKL